MNSLLLISRSPISSSILSETLSNLKLNDTQSTVNVSDSNVFHAAHFGLYCVRILHNQSFNRDQVVTTRKKLADYQIDFLSLGALLPKQKESLFVFDMDSTVIKEEVIDELARKHGVYDAVATVTKQAMEGGMGFDEALRLRVKHLAGLSKESFREVYDLLTLNDGMEKVFQFVPANGSKLGILSGGFTPVLKLFSEKYPVNFYRANGLEEVGGTFTGEIFGEIINREKKEIYLKQYANELSIPLEQVVAVGDGANDALMLAAAGIGIGIHAKSGLKEKITNWIEFTDLSALVFLIENSF
ncbi:phosphoserine phosphatase SerB [Leptospira sp. 2 VSF19]|uniref:Phosphoserine phosphatase n=1 Tax=Leptospira soteropolitanensis TaxID=2950025 RepID=A0AAW5VSZ6_9LEPT|nr:phosphoserine phosphatase SerB [Leptospira soteropolitanensis]MCW7494196.1 phosphoserine phosphatase SerB [Leptospira soteropolitanensis]MCW7501829.1 phosphoserine phosphatase SerB [Leptospira soteropolitanensis]MCW7524042.1 phosphoserine phosphatase SerB [Leptospira soteropolitanensis]MCW7527907.1 phosphoserine phosphatase SerB [Leptospira soteropolitanensis]MCW7531799.1 phosphoserine phosphatase SerB [Leptospira soteropolitanensis]